MHHHQCHWVVVTLLVTEAIEMFLELAKERQLSLDDLMQDVDQIRATGLTVPSRKAYCRQIIGAMDGQYNVWGTFDSAHLSRGRGWHNY